MTWPHPNPDNAFGSTYGEHRAKLELDPYDHKKLRDFIWSLSTDGRSMRYGCSVWDAESAVDIMSIDPDWIKIPSARNTDIDIFKALEMWPGEIHVSLGMTTKEELPIVLERWAGCASPLVFYHCTSSYPCEFNECRLLNIPVLTEMVHRLGRKDIRIGYSGHHKGIAIDCAAIALGAEYLERHFTLDRTMKGTDHAASLEPQGMTKLVRDVSATFEALTEFVGLMACERPDRKKLGK